jgi:hypothetical protein
VTASGGTTMLGSGQSLNQADLIWIALQPIDRPRSMAFVGPPAMDMCAPSRGINSSSDRAFQGAFGFFLGDLEFPIAIELALSGRKLASAQMNSSISSKSSPQPKNSF